MLAEKGQHVPRHQHRDFQLILAVKGRYTCSINGARIALEPLDLLLVKRGDWHEEFFESRAHYLALNFTFSGTDLASLGDIFLARGVSPRQQVVRGPHPEIRRIVELLERESLSRDQVFAHVENVLLTDVFWHFARSLLPEQLSAALVCPSTERVFLTQLRGVVEQHFSVHLTVRELAGKLGMSVRTLSTRCRTLTGLPPAKAIAHYRMEFSAYALRHSNMLIKEVSQQLGFKNQCHFSRVFRRCFGRPPSHYRRAIM